MRIASIVGARPQFIKAALLSKELRRIGTEVLINTGQHYDLNMSDIFFKQLSLKADMDLQVGSGTHAAQTARMLEAIDAALMEVQPDLVIVYGDTNTTLSAVLVASKRTIPIAHVEAGLRIFDLSVPEEVNRVVSDHLSDILFAPTAHAMNMLKNEGLGERSYLVGDVMVELLRKNMHKLSRKYIERLGLSEGGYVLCTIHRQDNVDVKKNLNSIFKGLTDSEKRILLPLHPRTRKKVEEFGLERAIGKNIMIVEPVGYIEMLSMMRFAEKVCTDSGGVQKEAFLLKRPCITLRTGTEWVETKRAGWNLLVGTDPRRISKAISRFEPSKKWKDVYPISDSAKRICKILRSKMNG